MVIAAPFGVPESSLALNRELLDIEVWDDNEIMQRQGKLLEIAVIVWPR